MSISDQILVLKIRRKDYDSFLKLYDRYWDDLYDMVFARTNHKEATEEILQNIWIRVWTEPNFLVTDDHGSAAGFLHRHAHYRVKDYYRVRKSELTPEEVDESIFEIEDSEYFEILNNHSVEALLASIQEVVDTMSPTEQQVYDLRINQKLSVPETAEKLGMSNKTVSNHLSKVLAEVRGKLGTDYETSKAVMTLLVILESVPG